MEPPHGKSFTLVQAIGAAKAKNINASSKGQNIKEKEKKVPKFKGVCEHGKIYR